MFNVNLGFFGDDVTLDLIICDSISPFQNFPCHLLEDYIKDRLPKLVNFVFLKQPSLDSLV